MTCCRRDAAKRKSSATGSIFSRVSSRIARILSAVGVPPGSFVSSTSGIRSASLRSCVVLPEPSIPSRVIKTISQPAKVVLAHQFLKYVVARQEPKAFAEAGAAAEAGELAFVGKPARFELVHPEKMSEL